MSIFHRYQSTIHGNYRRAYLRCGFIVDVLLTAYVLVRLLMGNPVASPLSYVSDAIMLVCIFLFGAYYRKSLPDNKVSLKELMLFGTGTAAVAALLYGLSLWGIGIGFPQQTVMFTNSLTPNEVTAQDPQLHYWAAMWAIVAAVESLLLGGFGTFLAAIFLRNEKSEVRKREKK